MKFFHTAFLAVLALIVSPVAARPPSSPSVQSDRPQQSEDEKGARASTSTTTTTPILSTPNIWAHAQTFSKGINTPSSVNVLAYGADPTGVGDSAAAFYNAMLAAGAGGTINVPLGIYTLNTLPWGSAFRNVNINAAPGVVWKGAAATAGRGGLSRYWIFGHPLTNPYNATSGPSLECTGLPQAGTGAPGTNVTECVSQELLGPYGNASPGSATGNTGLLSYVGLDNGDSIDNGNVGENLNIVTNIHNADNPVPSFGGVGIEVDMNVDVACRKTAGGAQGWTTVGAPHCSGNTGPADNSTHPWTFTGVFVDSGGAGGPHQVSLGGIGMQVKRDAGAWSVGYSCLYADSCIETDAYNHAMLIRTAYVYHTPNDPFCPGRSNCTVQNGIYFDNAPYWANTLFAGSLLANGGDGLVIARATDTDPKGRFINFVNRANTESLVSIDTDGRLVSQRIESKGNLRADTTLQAAPVTFASLAACQTIGQGYLASITDGPENPSWGQIIMAGGGHKKMLIYCNGTNWTVAAI